MNVHKDEGREEQMWVSPDLLRAAPLRPDGGKKTFLIHNVEQRPTAIVIVKLYEYSVNMCQQRQYYFKNHVWKILAVYINIYCTLFLKLQILKRWRYLLL